MSVAAIAEFDFAITRDTLISGYIDYHALRTNHRATQEEPRD
jgi:hypothetical protein